VKKIKRIANILYKNGINGTIKKFIYAKRQEKFNKYYYDKNSLLKAVIIGEKLVKMFPKELYNYQKLARAYWKSKDNTNAIQTLRRGLMINNQCELEEIITKIENSISNNKIFKSNRLIFKGGHQNLGLIEHKLDNKIWVTKIMPFKQSRGEYIIKDLQEKNVRFICITPKILNILKVNALCFITMEKGEGEEPKITDAKFIDKAYEIDSSITSIKYSDLPELINEQGINDKIILKHDSLGRYELLKALNFVHKRSVNMEILALIRKYLMHNNYSVESLKTIESLRELIVESNYSDGIRPEKHFTLQHGDFFEDNMLINHQSGELKVIDWGGIRVGPRWVDLAGFLAKTRQPFLTIQQEFLDHERCEYDPIEKIFFIYSLIVLWIVIFTKEEFEGSLQSFYSPAIKYAENIILKLEESFSVSSF
jgi:serine/threonine protein kinase